MKPELRSSITWPARHVCLQIFAILILCLWIGPTGSLGQDQKIDFAHDVVPILKKHCSKCHTNGTYKGGFSMDTRSSLLGSGAVEAGNAEDSDLVERILSKDEDVRMPPEGDRLSKSEIRTISQWIQTGIKWEPGFSFKKSTWQSPIEPRRVEIPATKQNPIDYLVDRYFNRREIAWPKSVDDATFARRVSMDLIGLLPTRSELQAFQDDRSNNKRQKLVNDLLQRNRDYADHWLTFWNDHLRNDYVGTGYIDGGRKQITGWLYRSLYENKPYDQFARELIAPQPESEGFIRGIKWRGNVNASQVRELQFAQSISQVFLGENLKCASCHDSFINDWKLQDAYGLAAIISDKPLELYRCDKPTGKYAGPKFLWPKLGEIDAKADKATRLRQTAELVTGRKNGRFSRTIINRLWKKMMGRGLVEPVDIMGNRPWDEDLLDYLAFDLQENGYDLKRTMALIANSRIYQSQSVATPSDTETEFTFRGPIIRRMTAEQFLDAVWQLTDGTPKNRRGPVPNLVATKSNATKKQTSGMLNHWIWNRADANGVPGNQVVEFKATINLEQIPSSGYAIITCDNEFTLFVNRKKVRNDKEWNSVEIIDLRKFFKKGSNSLRVSAKNHSTSPNPAGLYVSLVVNQKPISVGWKTIQDGKPKDAIKIKQPEIWAGVFQQIIARERMAMSNKAPSRTRASHVIADSLMRSLGRPNREQIVTTRDDQLSTLQALDLSNGTAFANILDEGGKRIIDRFQTSEKIIQHLYGFGLSRPPSREEEKVLRTIIGEIPSPDTVADLIWSVVMLPEFQHVR